MECSCRLWPTPGMYVVTSTAFVNRTRATLRNAEFGFFGVCVYTRMHTPRFSGQPINAGDFVLLITSSRPIRTSCENVGTVFPLFRPHGGQTFARKTSRALAGRTDHTAREPTLSPKGQMRIVRSSGKNRTKSLFTRLSERQTTP